MTVLKVAAVIVLALILLGLVRVGGGGEYCAEGARAWVWAGPFRVRVFPAKPKKTKEQKKGKEKPPEEAGDREEKAKSGGPVELAKTYLPLVCEAAGELKRRIRIDKLFLDYTVAGKEDAAAAAVSFGYSSAAAGMFLALFEQNFEVRERRVRTAVDFNAPEPRLYIYASVSARLGQLVSFALRFGWKFWKLYRRTKGGTKNGKKEAI